MPNDVPDLLSQHTEVNEQLTLDLYYTNGII